MSYKDLERRRTAVRESQRRRRAKLKAAADRLEAPPPGEEPCLSCERRRRTIAFNSNTAYFCRPCACGAVKRMVRHLCRTTEPETKQRCILCKHEPMNAATIPIFCENLPKLCRRCALGVVTFMLGQLDYAEQGVDRHAA